MGASGGFPVDLVLFAMIAVFLVLRLRGILGRRAGFERAAVAPGRVPPAGPVIEGHAEPVAGRPLPEPSSLVGIDLARIQGADRSFDPRAFLLGAENAFRLIVTAYAAGDRAALRPLLGPAIYTGFDQAIAARETAGETQRTEIKAIPTATIEAAGLRGSLATIAIRFVSDQITLTLGRDGHPVAGTDAVTEIEDMWTFERDLTEPGPSWRLVAAHSG